MALLKKKKKAPKIKSPQVEKKDEFLAYLLRFKKREPEEIDKIIKKYREFK